MNVAIIYWGIKVYIAEQTDNNQIDITKWTSNLFPGLLFE